MVTGTAGRDSSRCRHHENSRIRKLARDCEIKSSKGDLLNFSWKCGELPNFSFPHPPEDIKNNKQNNMTPPIMKKLTNIVPTTQLAKMSIDPKFVELTADVLEIFL